MVENPQDNLTKREKRFYLMTICPKRVSLLSSLAWKSFFVFQQFSAAYLFFHGRCTE